MRLISLSTSFVLLVIPFLKAATQVDNVVLPLPPAKTEAADMELIKVEEALDVIGAEVGDVILPPETADV